MSPADSGSKSCSMPMSLSPKPVSTIPKCPVDRLTDKLDGHMHAFEPCAFVYLSSKESEKNIQITISLKYTLPYDIKSAVVRTR